MTSAVLPATLVLPAALVHSGAERAVFLGGWLIVAAEVGVCLAGHR